MPFDGRLSDFSHGYTADKLLADLTLYFDSEVDFDREKIRLALARKGALEELVARATKNKTHPVSELIRDMLRDSSDGFSLGKIET
jgi:hypothetical protein